MPLGAATNCMAIDPQTCSVEFPQGASLEDANNFKSWVASQIWVLRAETAKAFTTVLAAFAFTLTSLPKIFRMPALVAGLTRVLMRARPGMVKMPVFFTSVVARAARLSRSSEHAFGFISCFAANAAQMAPFDMALAPDFMLFMDFMLFIGAMVCKQDWIGLLLS